jgi:hypothetical protein
MDLKAYLMHNPYVGLTANSARNTEAEYFLTGAGPVPGKCQKYEQ